MKSKNIYKLIFTLIPIYILIIALCLGYPIYGANDDVHIMNVLSGRFTGEPYAVTSYFHVALGWVISGLYRIVKLPWYPAVIIICNLVGQICLYSALFELIIKKNITIVLKAIMLMSMLVLSITITFTPTFTSSSTLIGIASIYLLHKEKRLMSIALLLMSVAIRMESGFVSCVYWGIYYIYLHFVKTKRFTWKFFINGALVAILALGVYAGDVIIKAQIEPEDYKSFNKQQSDHNDVGKQNLDNEEFEAKLSSIGWGRTLYELSRRYFSMDPRINIENLKELNKNNYINNVSISRSIKYTLGMLRELPELFNLSLLMFLSLISYIYYVVVFRGKGFWLALAILAINAIFLARLAIHERIIFTSLFTLCAPTLLIIFLLFERLAIPEYKEQKHWQFVDLLFAIAFLYIYFSGRTWLALALGIIYSILRIDFKKAVSLLLAAMIIFSAGYKEFSNIEYLFSDSSYLHNIKKGNADMQALEEYALSHPENIYIHGADYSLYAAIKRPYEPIFNLLFWGGTYVNSSAFNAKMKKSGLESYDINELFKDNVYFVSKESYNGIYASTLKQYFIERGYNADFKIVDNYKSLTVYKYFLN